MSHKLLWLFNFLISLKISYNVYVKEYFFLLITLSIISCKKPKDKIEDIVLYQDSIGYWNYEWPRKGAEYWGFTFKFMKNNKLQKLSFNKIENKRWAWNDYPYVESIYRWGIANDSIFTFMNYNSKIKITKYNKDTIWLFDNKNKRNSLLIKVKGNVKIEKPIEFKTKDAKTGKEIEPLDL